MPGTSEEAVQLLAKDSGSGEVGVQVDVKAVSGADWPGSGDG